MSDELIKEGDQATVPDLTFEEDTSGYVLEVAEEPEVDDANQVTKDEILARYEELKNQNQELTNKTSEISALKEGFAELGDKIASGFKKPEEGKPAPVDNPFTRKSGESESEWKERLNQQFLDDPIAMNEKFVQYSMAPLMEKQVQANLLTSKRFLEHDPKKGKTFDKYKDLIEQEVQKMSPNEKYSNPDIYSLAHDRVLAQNIGSYSQDLEEEITNRVMEKLKEEGIGQGSSASAPASRSYHHTETTANQIRPAGGGRVRASARDAEDIKQEAVRKGLDVSDYLGYLKRKGDTRVR